MNWADRLAVWFTLTLAVLALYLALDTIHESRDISLLTEEEHLLPVLELNREGSSAGMATDKWGALEEYSVARWDAEIHDRLKDNRAMRFLMHGMISSPNEDERSLLATLQAFRLRQAQKQFPQVEASAINNVLKSPNESEGAAQLAKLVTTGYYIKVFRNWGDGKARVLEGASSNEERNHLLRLFEVIEGQQQKLN